MATISIHWQERSKGKKGYLIIRGLGKAIWEPIGLTLTGNSKADKEMIESAERIRAKRLIEITERGYDLPPVLSNKDFLLYYKKVIDERPEYERRSSVYKHMVSYCSKTSRQQFTFRDVTENFWADFKKYLVNEKKHSQYTVHTVLSILKAVLNRAVREKVIPTNPLLYVTEKRPKSTRTYLTFEEIQKLNNTPCGSDIVRNAFLFACFTGLRISDIENLRKENFINDYIVVTMKKTKDSIAIPYDEKVMQYLPDFNKKEPKEFMFKLPASSTTNIIIHAWAAAAGINKRVSFHTSRHTFATLNLTYGTSIEVLKELLGHKDIRETQIYAKIIDEKKIQAIKNLPHL